ncbi:ABC transporter permease [Phocaeicola paurosaccharolyticus]|uniref:ABC transporter permease n=1 Tax=Phocaeicola paurosaccharolyticus TaxID=732242 RepID=UPI00046A5583|nr:ABC transporter permease [Phocaeicola paurosaccharolyticus]
MLLKYLLEKEFKQFIRNSFLPRMVVMMPIVMMFILPWAANQEVKDIKLNVVDHSNSTYSRRLVDKVSSSGRFILTGISPTYNKALKDVEKGDADIILEIPEDFEKELINSGKTNVGLSANSVNGTKGMLGSSYLSTILADYAGELQTYRMGDSKIMPTDSYSFRVVPLYKFNPGLDYKIFMVPAIMVTLITLLAGFLPALNIVSEKENGTIEQINVTPVSKPIFILAKLIPYWLVGFFVLTLCITMAYLVYGLVPAGSLLTIYFFASIYILVVSGMGLVISNYSDTMQQAMFVMFFFMLILILMSGLFTPISSMPDWAQLITNLNPLKYFIHVMRHIYLKGSTLPELTTQLFALCGFAVVLSGWAVISYRKTN